MPATFHPSEDLTREDIANLPPLAPGRGPAPQLNRRWRDDCDTCGQTVAFHPRNAEGNLVCDPNAADPVNHPAYYTNHPSGVECITVTEWFPFNVGNAIKYLWRAGEKGSAVEDLRKAAWYVEREIQRLGGAS